MQGWKLHVSATIQSAAQVFSRIESILAEGGVPFKMPRDLQHLLLINSGAEGFSQIGKFITVYPHSVEEAVALAEKLHRSTRGLAGPRVPFDLLYKPRSLVHYRYGSFRGTRSKPAGFIRAPDGKLIRDRRAPKSAMPLWLEDPFPKSRRSRPFLDPIGRDYLVFTAKSQRGKGGVYEAIDLSVNPPRAVIIKEGRRHGETDRDGKDARQRLRHEGRVLRALRLSGLPVPEVLQEFVQGGNRYLVLEFLPGNPLIPPSAGRPATFSWRRADRLIRMVSPLLDKVHSCGWVWRDLNPTHLLCHRGEIRLIDFETACRLGERRISPWGSADYLPPNYRNQTMRKSGTTEDDHALGVIAFQLMTGRLPPTTVRARRRYYKVACCPDRLRSCIERFFRF